MRKLPVLLMAFVMILSLAACGGGAPAKESKFTVEQQALAQEFTEMTETFNKIVDRVNASPQLLSDEELVKTMNELAEEISAADGYFANPETLTPEVAGGLKVAMEVTRTFIAEADAALDEAEGAGAYSKTEAVMVPVEIFNGTDLDIHALALSPANSSEWGENLITEVIKSGEAVQGELTFTADTLVWDILVQDGSQNQVTFMGVDFSNASIDGAKLFLESTEGGSYFASVN